MPYKIVLSDEEYDRLFSLISKVQKNGWNEELFRDGEILLFLVFSKATYIEEETDKIKKAIKSLVSKIKRDENA